MRELLVPPAAFGFETDIQAWMLNDPQTTYLGLLVSKQLAVMLYPCCFATLHYHCAMVWHGFVQHVRVADVTQHACDGIGSLASH